MHKTYVIAEAGVNHNGKLDLALAMVEQAKMIGADAVKFQLFSAEKLTTHQAKQANYQQKNSGASSQFDMLKSLELSREQFCSLKAAAEKANIDFIITPFDLESLAFIADDLDLPILKLGSGDITNGPLLLKAAHANKKIILSTGMSTLSEIEEALKVLTFGFVCPHETPTTDKLNANYASQAGQTQLADKVALLHCTSEYPAPIDEINLKAMDTINAAFGLPVGLSDHSQGLIVPIGAVARGAQIIEKHFTLDNNLPGPDHLASLNVHDFKTMVSGIRQIEMALGSGRKIPGLSESKNKDIVRRSLVANCAIKQGDIFNADNIGIKRPFGGMSPMHYWQKLGRVAEKDYEMDEML